MIVTDVVEVAGIKGCRGKLDLTTDCWKFKCGLSITEEFRVSCSITLKEARLFARAHFQHHKHCKPNAFGYGLISETLDGKVIEVKCDC